MGIIYQGLPKMTFPSGHSRFLVKEEHLRDLFILFFFFVYAVEVLHVPLKKKKSLGAHTHTHTKSCGIEEVNRALIFGLLRLMYQLFSKAIKK